MTALLIDRGAVVDKAARFGRTPLYTAAEVGIDTVAHVFL